MSEIELYIMRFAPEVQRRLLEIRSIVLNYFPDIEEKIYHGVPTFIINGKDGMNYGAYKNHITLYLGYAMTEFLKSRHPQYHYTKAAVQIPHQNAFPRGLIQEICKLFN